MRQVASKNRVNKLSPLTEPVMLILTSLAAGARHGYALMKDIEAISEGRVLITTGTLYGALRRLLDAGWIERFDSGDTSRDKQTYRLTASGRRLLVQEVERMRHAVQAASQRLAREGV